MLEPRNGEYKKSDKSGSDSCCRILGQSRADVNLDTGAPQFRRPSLFHVTVEVPDAPNLAASFIAPGQYLQLRTPSSL
ncbi:hypothetical protein ZIOFF_060106 [Zingiber officinale]|uniref:FAD-binding FR-type domain-containing protein n=1 Tax=Zingiber officinale TaxID=94328 RepID=A0A8J5FMK0_ZINOF|nr:hypothetical protein ZIOFF_060106 [Zingiber officinale]